MKWLGAVAIGVVALGSINFARVDLPAQTALEGRDYVTAHAYYRYGVDPSSIVFDIWGTSVDASGAGVLGALFDFAEEMKNREFSYVYLAYRGNVRFRISGKKFSDIGQSLSYQNPVYLIRTLPESVEAPDGRSAFGSWSGGLLGVLNAQMEDVNQLNKDWWINDEINRY